MTNPLPKFDFGSVSQQDLDTIKSETTAGRISKYFDPGSYDVVIKSAEYHVNRPSDPTWMTLMVTYEGAGGRTIREAVLIPTKSVTYRGGSNKATDVPFKKLKNLVEALGGGDLGSLENMTAIITQLFADPSKLVGLNVNIVVGYEGNNIRYEGKNNGTTVFSICDKAGVKLLQAGGKEPILFNSRDEAKAYAADNGITLSLYTDVKKHSKSAVANDLSGSGNTNW